MITFFTDSIVTRTKVLNFVTVTVTSYFLVIVIFIGNYVSITAEHCIQLGTIHMRNLNLNVFIF